MLPFGEASNVQVFHLTAGNSDYMTLPLNVGQSLSGSFSVTGSADDQLIAFWVTNPWGMSIVDYGLVSSGAEFNFTADEGGIYSLHFSNFPTLSNSEKTVTLTYDVTTPEASGPDYFFVSAVVAIVLGLLVTFIFIAYDRKRSRRPVRELRRTPMVRIAHVSNLATCFF